MWSVLLHLMKKMVCQKKNNKQKLYFFLESHSYMWHFNMLNSTFNSVIECVCARARIWSINCFRSLFRCISCWMIRNCLRVLQHFFECRRWLSFVRSSAHVWIYIMIKSNFYMDEFEFTFNIHSQLLEMSEWMSMHSMRINFPLLSQLYAVDRCIWIHWENCVCIHNMYVHTLHFINTK